MKSGILKALLAAAAVACSPAGGRLAAFEIKPIILPIGREVTVTIRAVNDAEKKILAETPLYALSDNGTWSDGKRHGKSGWRPEWEKIALERRGDAATFRITLPGPGEGWHTFRFGEPDQKWNFDPKKTSEFMLYRLKPDLFALRPWKGDIHQHSVRCGHAKLEPPLVPAHCRRVGFDFMALSEHRLQSASVEMIAAAKPWNSGLELFTGEEFHTPSAMLHSVAVGHRTGINEWRDKNLKEFNRRVAEEKQKPIYRDSGLNATELHEAAMSMVMYQLGREFGARLLVYSHPTDYDRTNNRENPTEAFRNFMFAHADYDALELPNVSTAAFRVSTRAADRLMLMNSLVLELYAKGGKFSLVAASDCHDQRAEYFGKVYTVIFAKACDVESFAAAVKSRMCVALRSPATIQYFCVGPVRLMKYQQFLERAYWPGHDALCRKQGELLLKRAAGDLSVQPEIEKLAAEIAAYREACFAPVK